MPAASSDTQHAWARASRRQELAALATRTGARSPALLAVALDTLEVSSGWHVTHAKAAGEDHVTLTLEKHRLPLTRSELLERLRTDVANGIGYRELARQLEQQGIPTPRGLGPWRHSTIRYLLRDQAENGDQAAERAPARARG